MESSGSPFELMDESAVKAENAAALLELIDVRAGKLRGEVDERRAELERLSHLRWRVVQAYGPVEGRSVVSA